MGTHEQIKETNEYTKYKPKLKTHSAQAGCMN